MTASTRILLVDDHPLVREGLRCAQLAQTPGLEVVGEAGDAEQAFARVSMLRTRSGADGRRHEAGQRHRADRPAARAQYPGCAC